MIKYFAIENYRSIKKECVIDFDLNIPKNNPFPANTIIGFAGANASGKTTVLQALTFVIQFMRHSFLLMPSKDGTYCESHYTLEDKPTKFHLIFSRKVTSSKDQEEKFIDYEYILHLTKEQVIYEELNYYSYGRKKVVYIRNNLMVTFGKSAKKFHTKDLRTNSSIVSLAKQFESQWVAKDCGNYLVQSNVNGRGLNETKFGIPEIKKLLENDELSKQLDKFINVADIGIEQIFLKQKDNDAFSTAKTILFKHKLANSYANFSANMESSGTLQFLAILSEALTSINDGALLIIDEIEIKLHQNLVAYLIGLFQNPSFNTKGAQLIFSFHNSYLMNILEPHQLWFTQKNDNGETEVFSANDFKDISKFGKEHLEELYRIGRFGAIPRGI